MTLILFLAALAIGADALLYSGTYTQAAYQEIAARLDGVASSDPSSASNPTEAEDEQPAGENEDAHHQSGVED